MAAVQPAEEPKLAAGAVSLVGQLFQSITHMAPAAGIVFSAQYMATKGGAVLPLAWLLAAVACMLLMGCLFGAVAMTSPMSAAPGFTPWFLATTVDIHQMAG